MSKEKDEPKKGEKDELEKRIKECQKERADYLAGWQRAQADFLNYKKEETKRLEDFSKYVKEELILKILPILDNFEKAACQKFYFENLKEEEKKKAEQIVQGFLQIKAQLKDFLKAENVEEIKSVGEKFDPNLHEAIEEVAGDGLGQAKEPGIISEEIQKGYMINGRLLRPAKVKVSK